MPMYLLWAFSIDSTDKRGAAKFFRGAFLIVMT
ncbi:Uncharacterised protein [Providencia stuartii]|nr:Uncharacterised protein [Providencia stuartii]